MDQTQRGSDRLSGVGSYRIASSRWLHLPTAINLALLALLGAGCATARFGAPRISVDAIHPWPPFTTNAPGVGRDAGSSTSIGESVVWLFGDTFVGDDGLLTATAAWSSLDLPLQLEEPVDSAGWPFELFQYSAAERDFNRAHANPPECCFERCEDDRPDCGCSDGTDCTTRLALWPGDPVATEDGRIFTYYETVIAGVGPYDLQRVATGLAIVEPGSTVAGRLLDADDEAVVLFGYHEPNYLHALAVTEAEGTFVYLYAAVGRRDCDVDVVVARVPIAQITERAAYRFWDGGAWSDDVADSQPILVGIAGGLGSVTWSDYLGSYISGFLGICTPGAQFLLRTAALPQGPWSEATAIDLRRVGADRESYAGRLHPVLSHGRRLVISFYRPEIRDETIAGRIHLAELRLGGGSSHLRTRLHPPERRW